MAIMIKQPETAPFPPYSSNVWHIYKDTGNYDRGPVLVCKSPLTADELLSLDRTGLRHIGDKLPSAFEFVRAVPMKNFNVEEI